MTLTAQESGALDRAAALAARSLGSTSPNPPVGAVVLDAAGVVVGEGRHRVAGGPHAEVLALQAAGDAARGGTVVVSLEPCATHGRTPPCTEALRAARVTRVVFAVADSTKAGGGAGSLIASGVDVVGPIAHAGAERVVEPWLTAQRRGRPYVHLKLGTTLDGRVAAADGTSRWITSEDSRADAHRLRAESDAIVVGTGTALADDPALTVRHGADADRRQPPLRVVVGDRALPATAHLLDEAAETVQLPGGDPGAVLTALAERGVVSVLLEGGPTLAGAFLQARLVDRVTVYLAPLLLGAGPAALATTLGTLAEAVPLRIDAVDRIGPDLRVSAVVEGD